MSLYRIPIRLTTTCRAANKAQVDYAIESGFPAPRYVGAPDCVWVEVHASTLAEAVRKLHDAVRPGDPRPIMGRGVVKHFRVPDPPPPLLPAEEP